jgi:sirohydrochlorin cobaltochelatase
VSRDVTRALLDWLSGGGTRIGELLVTPAAGGWELRHMRDAGRTDLRAHHGAEAARHLANLDAAGAFRPLKTAPTLITGWRLLLADAPALRLALDFFYPAMIGVWFSHQHDRLTPVILRQTLGRQTGMYRVTQKLTDLEARALIDTFCADCMKRRLWEISTPNPQPPVFPANTFPLLCHEACNLLVAKAREVVKKDMSQE